MPEPSTKLSSKLQRAFADRWCRFWMRRSGLSAFGRLATRLACWFTPPYKARASLARMTPRGFISPSAVIHCPRLHLGKRVFIGDQVIIYQSDDLAGEVEIGDHVSLHKDIIIEVGARGSLSLGADTHVQPRCLFAVLEGPIRIGSHVQIAPYCAFYSYNHSFETGTLIRMQPLTSKGGIVIEDDVWLGVGVIVLDGVRIGKGAVVAAGAVVNRDIPEEAIAAGVPARIIGKRGESEKDLSPTASFPTDHLQT